MELRNRNTGAVITESEFRSLHKNTSFPAQIRYDEWGYDIVFEGPQATVGRYQVSARDGVEQVSGKWYTKWIAIDIDADARTAKDAEQAKNVRADRNQRIAECDWTQLPDAPVDKAVWATYRQSLRDISKQAGFPWEVTWPVAP
jgi:hypothetical protein